MGFKSEKHQRTYDKGRGQLEWDTIRITNLKKIGELFDIIVLKKAFHMDCLREVDLVWIIMAACWDRSSCATTFLPIP